MTKNERRWNVAYLIFSVICLFLVQAWWVASQQIEVLPYSEFERQLEAGRVARVVVEDKQIIGYLKTPDQQGKRVIAANLVEPGLAQRLSRFNVPYAREFAGSFLRDVISWVAPAFAFFGVWYFLFRRFAEKQGMGGFMSLGKSRARLLVE